MQEALGKEGILIDLILASFTHPEGVEAALRRVSFWRKPNAGMVLEAAQRLNLDLSRSVMIGDKESDMQAALAAGVGKAYWLGGEGDLGGKVLPAKSFEEISLD
jgi:D-glycero-D-manno-heptose 1,7-bisphosphate phosphatase